MLPIRKHPDSIRTAIADFARQLATGQTLSSVALQPVVVRAAYTADNTTFDFASEAVGTKPVFGNATVNGSDVSIPNGERKVIANQGVTFTVAKGSDGVTYFVKTGAVKSGTGDTEFDELPIVVDRNA